MKNKIVASVIALATLAPVGAFAMPVAGAKAPASFDGARIERAEVIVRTGRPAVRVVRPVRPAVRVVRPVRPAARVIVR